MHPYKNAAYDTLIMMMSYVDPLAGASPEGTSEAQLDTIDEAVGSLDSLSIRQLLTAWMYFHELPKRINDSQLGQFMEIDAWFFNLTSFQQDQVVAYGRTQNVGKLFEMVPNWYKGYGQSGAFRFEAPINLPVASR